LVVKEQAAKFTLGKAIGTSMAITAKFNKCDKENSKAACKFSTDGFHNSIAEQLSKRLEPKDGFALAWIKMIFLIQ
jgi:hypothetical protein